MTFVSRVREATDTRLSEHFSANEKCTQQRLLDAMRYAVLNGGKRVRPALCFAAASALIGEEMALANSAVLTASCAVELIHAYSLVHDDLPAMDDDDLRRGNPTTHIAFDEATAILAGDALQTLAFELIANDTSIDATIKVACLSQLAGASGAMGMCGGQMIDIEAVGKRISLSHLEKMHSHKTGALIRASLLLGAFTSGKSDAKSIEALTHYADAIGLAFQVKDDILDATATTDNLGKRQGADEERGKPTYVSELGLEGAEFKLDELEKQAVEAVALFGKSAEQLIGLTHYIVQRSA